MKVYFKNNWFSPRGTRYRKERSYNIPDEWEKYLPANVEILADEELADTIEPDMLEKPSRRERKKREAPKDKVAA